MVRERMRILITIGAMILFLAGPLYAQDSKETNSEKQEKSLSPPKEKNGLVDLLIGKDTKKTQNSGNSNTGKDQSVEEGPTAGEEELDYLDEDEEE